jgi:hypothetical protein
MRILLKSTGGLIYQGSLISIGEFLDKFTPVSENNVIFDKLKPDEIVTEFTEEDIALYKYSKLLEFDWVVTKAFELSQSIPDKWVQYR